MCDQWTWALNLRTLEHQGWLYLCWHPQAFHICSSSDDPNGGESSELFDVSDKVNEHLRGLVLDGVEIPRPFERVCQLIFRVRASQTNNGDEPVKKLVYFEGQGRYSNVVVANPDNRILVVAHQVGKGQSGYRQVQVGGIYELPPEQVGKLIPSFQTEQQEWKSQLLQTTQESGISEAIIATYAACTISNAKEVCRWSRIEEDLAIKDLSEDQWSSLFSSWKRWIALLEKDVSFQPHFLRFEDNTFTVFAPQQNGGVKSLGESIREYYNVGIREERYQQLHQHLLKQVRNAIKKMDTKIKKLQQQVDNAEQMEATKKRADLLMANAYRYKGGMQEIEVDDWETGEKVTIEIDPDCNLIQTAEQLFKKVRKFRRTEENVQPIIDEAKQDLEYLYSVEENVVEINGVNGTDEDWTALKGIQDELVEEGFMKPPSDHSLAKKSAKKTQKIKNKTELARIQVRKFQSPNGFTVLAGRNNVQNDELSLRIANKGDQWFHARGVPGSHVVLRLPPGQDAAEEDIQFAANIASYYSKAKMDGKVYVTATDASNVRKVPRGKPGMVTFHEVGKEQVVMGYPDKVVEMGLVETDA